MKGTVAIALAVQLSVAPALVLAKGATTKIIIEGPDLSKPIEISDPKVLAHFNVWAGPGTSSTQPGLNANAPSFIIDWSAGPIAPLPEALQKYHVLFFSEERSERPVYVVYYAVPPSSGQGYVYLPGSSDKWWQLNTFSILRGVEGKWFHALDAWENLAIPLIKKARMASKS